MRGRLAPSPTGALHLGNARTFLLAWLSLRAQGGAVVLRVEDLDGPRVKAGAVESAVRDLRWLGLDWDEGPDVGGPGGPYVQTKRRDWYRQALDQLIAAGHLYACCCSRGDIERAASAPHPGEEGPRYPGTCRTAQFPLISATPAESRPLAWRFRVPAGTIEFDDGLHGRQSVDVAEQVGDFVVRKANGTPAYQLAVVVDDAAMAITEVVRGDDLLASTPRQLLLYQALGLTPPRFLHVPLVIGPDGRRLAKRHGDTRIAYFREQGVPAERIVGQLAAWSGLVPTGTACMPQELIEGFDWRKVPRQSIVCNNLDWTQ